MTRDYFSWVEMLLKEGQTIVIFFVVCIILFFNRCFIKNIILNVKKININDNLSIIFNQEVRDAETIIIEIIKISEIPNVNSYGGRLPIEVSKNFDDFVVIALSNPCVAVLSAWRELELTAITLANDFDVNITGNKLGRASGIASLESIVINNKQLEYNVIDVYKKIGKSTKKISYEGGKCRSEDAVTFCINARRLSEYLSSLIPQ